MFRYLRKFAVVLSAVIVFAATLFGIAFTPAAEAADPINFTFRFVNGQTISGVASDKDHFIPNAGGTSATNPTGMTVHLSCSDKFTGGWGEKEGPTQGVDTAWQIDSYFIQKDKKTCGTPTPPAPPPDPPAVDIEKFVNGQDADDPTGPEIQIGETATFSYEVTNTGGIPLRDVEVTDSELGAISCPKTELAVDESMSCSEKTETVTTPGQFTMKATVTAIGDVLTPGLPPGVDKGDAYRFTFVNGITISKVGKKDEFFPNAGGTSVTNPSGMKVHLSCSDKFIGGWGQKDGPQQGVDTAWQIASFSIGKVKDGRFELKCGSPFVIPEPEEVMDMDPVYFIVPPPPPADPRIKIEKFINGDDADTPPGPTLPDGSTARFTYVVLNTGDVPLENIAVNDNVMGPISCPRTQLGVGERMNCTATTMEVDVGERQFMEACVRGSNDGREVSDCDPVWYRVPPPDPPEDPKIKIEKFVNGDDADSRPGPTLPDGSTATFTYIVLNIGETPLEGISVADNVMGPISCPRTELGVGERMNCTPTTMKVSVGDHTMEACVRGFNAGRQVSDCDPVFYRVPPPKPPIECVVEHTKFGPKVKWSDVNADHYQVWRDGEAIGSTNELMFTDHNAPVGKTLVYRVVAMFPDWKVMVGDCGKIKIPFPPDQCSVHLKFYNHTDEVVDVRWIGPDGAETTLGQPAPGETFHWDEFNNQKWKIYDSHGKLIMEYTPHSCGEHFVLIARRH